MSKIRHDGVARYVQNRWSFEASNLYARNICSLGTYRRIGYGVYSYNATFPLYIYSIGDAKWYENSTISSATTERHRKEARPDGPTILLPTYKMREFSEGVLTTMDIKPVDYLFI